ncbi:hypothetical protein FPOA_05073 [Fusarium poae]|jgi:hypothetical protein|uniref:Uncharacterized protein n=1 Tax=Fusarium poae TaxID=36050 RepID=A0A1B8AVI8_FUSPO|nr:hypothetical protein FPOA_05073 [Fusarium poae]
MRTRNGTETHEENTTSTQPRGHKRQSSKKDSSAPEPEAKQAKKTQDSNAQAKPPITDEQPEAQKPTLTEKDLEFDFDYSQIRDPRRTPGRVKRPRYEERDLSEEWLSKFHIPNHKSPHTDPLYTFYDLYKCHKKGPDGSPTYDSAGFQLDYKKVEQWMKPQRYNKKSIMNGMDRSLKRAEDEKQMAYETFFVDGKGPEGDKLAVMDLIKDQMSKDMNVPFHQIDVKQMKKWGEKGFKKVKVDEWWSELNQVERDRFMKMHGGSALRKHL